MSTGTDTSSHGTVGHAASTWRDHVAEAPHAIRVDGLSVRLELQRERVLSLREQVIRTLKRRPAVTEEFWPVRNVSFTVRRGEAFGIVGRNGAGKSTLLKVVAGIIAPTVGRVEVRGRIAPLLELGAGFDAELTGRENVYLYGSLLGFSRRQLQERFDRIVEFAELEEFIDVPLKNYSSGMATRLGFAVASDVDADILIVDEALTVGDARFQLKCMERIESYLNRGVSILLVSHTPEHIERICQRALWIDQGVARLLGPALEVIAAYGAGELEAPSDARQNFIPSGTLPASEPAPAPLPVPSVDEGALVEQYDFIDVSTDGGGSTLFWQHRTGGRGLCVTGDEAAVSRMRRAGIDAVIRHPMDASFQDGAAGFVSLLAVLHFLSGLEEIETLLARSARWARDFIFIRIPSYEDEAYLRSLGLKFYWQDWSDAPSHPRLDQLISILHSLGHDQYTVRFRHPVISSDAVSVLPESAPLNQHEYDEVIHGPKPALPFARPVFQHIDLIVALRPFDAADWREIVSASDAF